MNKIEFGDCREIMQRWKNEGVKVQTVVTSPPYYGLRDYGHDGQIGLEETPQAYIDSMVDVFAHVWDILSDDGTLWLNIGDSYSSHKDCKSIGQTLAKGTSRENAHVMDKGISRVRDSKMLKAQGFKNKELIGIPWRLAFALQDFGWYLRQDIIWSKPNPMPESVKDRCTKSHEYIFLLSKNQNYYFDTLYEPSVNIEKRRKRSVWEVQLKPYKGAHFATYPEDLIQPCILASSRVGDTILDPFLGSGTTARVSERLNRNWVGCELNESYLELQEERLERTGLHSFFE